MGQVTTLKSDKSKFIYYSIRERLAFQELTKFMDYRLHYVSDTDGYDKWDVIFTDKAQFRNIAEVKIRKHHSTDFEGWVFEKNKYDALINSIEGRLVSHIKLKPLYILFLYDCVAIWDVTKIDANSFESEVLRHQSVNGNEDLVDKDVTYLKIKDATIINYILDYDKLNFNAKTVFKFQYPNNGKDVINL